MNEHFAELRRLGKTAACSPAVDHPYLRALAAGELPNMFGALQDFAGQYGAYSRHFVASVTAVIDSLENESHKKMLRANLAEERGEVLDADLPPAMIELVAGQPHAKLYRRFQEALGVSVTAVKQQPESESRSASVSSPGALWGQRFRALCSEDQYCGIGAIGIGTELIVSPIYAQILQAIKEHSDLSFADRVFFDLHSVCDAEHADQLLQISRELAVSKQATEKIIEGARAALSLRIDFWDQMLERALALPRSLPDQHWQRATA